MTLNHKTMMRTGGILTVCSILTYTILSFNGYHNEKADFQFAILYGMGLALYLYPVLVAMTIKIIETIKWAKQEWNKKD